MPQKRVPSYQSKPIQPACAEANSMDEKYTFVRDFKGFQKFKF